MSILRIRTIGDPVLRTPAQTVTDFDDSLEHLVKDMIETMYAVGGVGLAAPQVGVGLRIFTWGLEGQEGHVVNPELQLGEDPQEGSEGCLSVPELSYETPRRDSAVLTGVDLHGEPVRYEATGLLARCFQHETDHLAGMLYVDRLRGESRAEAMKVLRSPQYQHSIDRVHAERDAQLAGTVGPSGSPAHDGAAPAAAPRSATGSAFGRATSAGPGATSAGSAFFRSGGGR